MAESSDSYLFFEAKILYFYTLPKWQTAGIFFTAFYLYIHETIGIIIYVFIKNLNSLIFTL